MLYFKLKLYVINFFILIFCYANFLNADLGNNIQALNTITSTVQNLAQRSEQLSIKPVVDLKKRLIPKPFSLWHQDDYSVIQLYVLDQFLTVEQFLEKTIESQKDIANLPTIFKHPEKIASPLSIGEIKLKVDTKFRIKRIKQIQKELGLKIKTKEINPNSNIGGGEESCGYQAIKNAILIAEEMEDEPRIFLKLNDPILANNLFGTYTTNKLLNIQIPGTTKIEEGHWRKIVVEHRITVKESSIKTSKKAVQKSLDEIKNALEEIRNLVTTFGKSPTSDLKNEILKFWEKISNSEQRATREAHEASEKSKEIATQIGDQLAQEAASIAAEAKKISQEAKNLIPKEIFTIEEEKSSEEEETEEESYSSEEESDEESEYESDNGSESEEEEGPEESEEQPNIPALSLTESEKTGDFLDVSDVDYLYDNLKQTNKLPESTTLGSQELGVEPLESRDPVEQETAEELFNRIITELSKDSSKQHIIFVGGGSHWATVVIKIINNRLYYIIADSTNEQRYGVDLNKKGIFITKAIQKIIDGTKDSLIKLVI